MSAIEKRLEAQWMEINEHERAARARFDEMSDRDFHSRPWTDEDHESIRIMIQWMTSQLARNDMRLNLIFAASHNTLREVKQLTFVAIAAAIGALIAKLLWH